MFVVGTSQLIINNNLLNNNNLHVVAGVKWLQDMTLLVFLTETNADDSAQVDGCCKVTDCR